MCPLRVILIFLSATLAGFFVLRSLRDSQTLAADDDRHNLTDASASAEDDPLPFSTKVGSAICAGFWTAVDMASGRYLWKNLVSSSSSPHAEKTD